MYIFKYINYYNNSKCISCKNIRKSNKKYIFIMFSMCMIKSINLDIKYGTLVKQFKQRMTDL